MLPNKICVAPHQIYYHDLDTQEVGHNGAEEYIRKDALLEWINEHRQLHGGVSWNTLIDKINSL